MATTTTYAVALTTIKDFAVNAGFDNDEILEKIDKLISQKSKTKTITGKSKARKANEELAQRVHDLALTTNEEITNKWVRENFDEIASPARATAVMNVAVDMGLFHRNIVPISATRNTVNYTIK